MKAIKWIKSIICSCEIAEHNRVLSQNKDFIKELTACGKEITDVERQLTKMHKKLKKYHDNDIHSDLSAFNAFLTTIPATECQYRFRDKLQPVHEIFERSIEDEDVIRDFITKDMKFNNKVKAIVDAESLVMIFCKKFRLKYSTFTYYTSDMELYGKSEYWAIAMETIDKIFNNKKYGDCDDKMVLIYSCLYYLLKDKYPNDLWRLRGMIVDLWSGGGHALLTWVSNEHNDWIALETTFKDVWQDKISSYRVRNQMFYQIRYTFDNKHEYVKN